VADWGRGNQRRVCRTAAGLRLAGTDEKKGEEEKGDKTRHKSRGGD
jgi:hypothetical protein